MTFKELINNCKTYEDCLNCSYAYICHILSQEGLTYVEIIDKLNLSLNFCPPDKQIEQFSKFLINRR